MSAISETLIPVSQDPLDLAEQGIKLREQGAFVEAVAIFQNLMTSHPQLVYGWQEMAVLEAMRGRPHEALRLFMQARQIDRGDFQSCMHLTVHQIKLGRLKEAKQTLHAFQPDSDDVQMEILLLQEFIAFIELYPQSWSRDFIIKLQQTEHYLDVEMIEARIFDAIESHNPLSFIRLGDGEGAWLTISPEDEIKFVNLYETNRRKMLKVWFGTDLAYELASFRATQQKLIQAIKHADILGLPYVERFAHEYAVCSYNGVASNTNILRLLGQLKMSGNTKFCTQDMHAELQSRDFYARLLALPIDFGIISCHPDIGYRLAKTFGARVVEMLIIPEEKGFSDVTPGLPAINGISGMAAPHFPIIYQRILTKLQQNAGRAQVWLVAAGYLGKIYCNAIRDAGAIALDIGSIADGWAGKVTRPYLRSIKDFEI